VAWWRRAFLEAEEKKVDDIVEIIEAGIDIPPIAAPEKVFARQEFSKEPWRNLTQQARQAQAARTPEQVLISPNLQVSSGDEFMYLAQ
jgi:hypothetical protein